MNWSRGSYRLSVHPLPGASRPAWQRCVDDACRASQSRAEGWGPNDFAADPAAGAAGLRAQWISTTYTLRHLVWLGVPSGNPAALAGCERPGSGRAAGGAPETCIVSILVRLTAAHGYEAERLDDCRRPPSRRTARRRRLELRGRRRSGQAQLVPHQHPGAGGPRRLSASRRPSRHRGGAGTRAGVLPAAPVVQVPSHRPGGDPWQHPLPPLPQWHFDVLRGLEHFVDAGAIGTNGLATPSTRAVRARRADGRGRHMPSPRPDLVPDGARPRAGGTPHECFAR